MNHGRTRHVRLTVSFNQQLLEQCKYATGSVPPMGAQSPGPPSLPIQLRLHCICAFDRDCGPTSVAPSFFDNSSFFFLGLHISNQPTPPFLGFLSSLGPFDPTKYKWYQYFHQIIPKKKKTN